MKTEPALELHRAGEGDFVFPTDGGTVRLRATGDALTPFGGLVPWAAFVRRCGFLEALSGSGPVVRTSPKAAPIYDVLQSYALTVLCDGDRFAQVQRLRCDPTLCDLFGGRSIVSDDTIRRLFGQVEEAAGAAWVAAAAVPLWGALPEPLILDWDATVQPKYGQQEGAAIGDNPHRPGRRSLHPLLAVAAGTRLCVALLLPQRGHGERHAAMEDARRALGTRQVWLNRGDLGFGHERIMAWHEASAAPRPHSLFKLRLTANVRRALAALPESAWQGPAQLGVLQVAEITLRLPGWSRARRVVAGRRRQAVSLRSALLIAGRFTQSGRQKQFCIGVAGALWEQLKAGDQRICRWLEQTAPQLKSPTARAPDFAFLKPAPA